MGRITVMLIPERTSNTKQFTISRWVIRSFIIGGILSAGLLGYVVFDYIELVMIRSSFQKIAVENAGLKGEARALMGNLEDVKLALRKVQDYTEKLQELTNLKVSSVSKKTGIGPLSPEEYQIAQDQTDESAAKYVPLGLNMDKLIFKPVFDKLNGLSNTSNRQVIELQKILSNLSQQKSLLSSVPSISPVNGWVTSGFGPRISPFTSKRSMHQGLDIASPSGTPIFSPADGVVIFTGTKAGFGNFIMIAHGYGLVTRFGHNAQNMVQPGQRVKRGDQIATVGMSGRTTGPHVHYEVLLNGRYVNPKKFILNMSEDLFSF